jgi:uncharacterized protein (DUF433 family)
MLLNRITSNDAVMGGKPCIRGMRVTVGMVLGLLATGSSRERILEAYPYLEPEDIDAALAYAADSKPVVQQHLRAMKTALEDLENRRPVWRALSDLFLDNEPQPFDLEYISSVLAKSPYNFAELEHVLYCELYPVCIGNLLCVAGEWILFSDEWLEAAIRQYENAIVKVPRALHAFEWMVSDHWKLIRQRVEEMRTA